MKKKLQKSEEDQAAKDRESRRKKWKLAAQAIRKELLNAYQENTIRMISTLILRKFLKFDLLKNNKKAACYVFWFG